MSEYWKSTPKYWCKHCKTFVRDTKLEKTNHEATPKHQGNLKRFLRDLHRGHEKDEKDKERAKAEVARLNGVFMGSGVGSSSIASGSGLARGPEPPLSKPQATAAQRKQQLTQLAEMGISIPDEFRPDMAMAGEWQVTSQRIVDPAEGEKRPEAIALGVRKREPGDADEEELEAKRNRWGSSYKTHPVQEFDLDLDDLLSRTTGKAKVKVEVKEELAEDAKEQSRDAPTLDDGKSKLKREPSEGDPSIPAGILALEGDAKGHEGDAMPGVVFKKRKAKNFRQK